MKRNNYTCLLLIVINMEYCDIELLYLRLLENEIQINESKRKNIFDEMVDEKFWEI